MSGCGRQALGDLVRVYRNGEAVSTSGVWRCGNTWGCIVCGAKVMRRRSEQLSALFEKVHEDRGQAVMVTFTASHAASDSLESLLGSLKSALRAMTQDKEFRGLVRGRIGWVSATEIKWSSRNGWHPHQHQAWFFRRQVDCEKLAESVFCVWRRICARYGLRTEEFYGERRIGVDVRRAWDASEYLAKFDRERDWSLAAEMTGGRLKTGGGSGSLTPWGLLEEAVQRGGDSRAAALWVEYLRATKGKACVSFKGAARLFGAYGLSSDVDDWADANAQGEGEVIGTINADEYEAVIKEGGLGRLLESARNGGVSGLRQELGLQLSSYRSGQKCLF